MSDLSMLSRERKYGQFGRDGLRSIMDYDPATGRFVWAINSRRGGRPSVGLVAGTVKVDGYRRIVIRGSEYLAHRLAWLYMTGEWPAGLIDHRDGDRDNNAWPNLRLANRRINQENRRIAQKNNLSTGVLGVGFDKNRGKFTARIKAGGKLRFLGRFKSAADAQAVYLDAKRRLHEGCTL